MDKAAQVPWSAQVELTEGCNRRCSFCGIKAFKPKTDKTKTHMTKKLAKRVADDIAELCPRARIEFAMHGEPLLNPKKYSIIKIFRKRLDSQFMLTTNGIELLKKPKTAIKRLFACGINILMIDTYKENRAALLECMKSVKKVKNITVVDFYKDWAPKGKSPWTNYRGKEDRVVVLMDDLGERDGERASRKITNQGGNNVGAGIPENPLDKLCTIPFREISICANGDVCVCCNDYSHEYVCGNINIQSLKKIWYGNNFRAARRILYSRKRTFSPCGRCNLGSGTRVGLLPKYKEPTTKDFKRAKNVVFAHTSRSLIHEPKIWFKLEDK